MFFFLPLKWREIIGGVVWIVIRALDSVSLLCTTRMWCVKVHLLLPFGWSTGRDSIVYSCRRYKKEKYRLKRTTKELFGTNVNSEGSTLLYPYRYSSFGLGYWGEIGYPSICYLFVWTGSNEGEKGGESKDHGRKRWIPMGNGMNTDNQY